MSKSRHPRKKARRLQGWLLIPRGAKSVEEMILFERRAGALSCIGKDGGEVARVEVRFK